MAKTTCKGLTYAVYGSGGSGTAVTYTGGKQKTDFLCKVEINENRDQQKEYADGHQIDSESRMVDVTVALELANTDADIRKDILGHKSSGTGQNAESSVTDAEAPYIGVGFILANRHLGVVTYEAYWFYKMQFSSGGVTSTTRKDTAQWEHETINGTGSAVQLAAGGDLLYYAYTSVSTEAAAVTWLKGKAGIS